MYSLFIALPLENPALLLTWRPPAVMRVVLSSPRLLVNCPLVPRCSPLFPASLPSGLPRNPNVLLIRTHPNPFPSVANSSDSCDVNINCKHTVQVVLMKGTSCRQSADAMNKCRHSAYEIDICRHSADALNKCRHSANRID
jgi:hypothetical protein